MFASRSAGGVRRRRRADRHSHRGRALLGTGELARCTRRWPTSRARFARCSAAPATPCSWSTTTGTSSWPTPRCSPCSGSLPDEIIGRPLLEVVDYEPLRELFEQGQPGTVELALTGGRTAQVDLVPVTTGFGEPVGLTAIVRDVTLRKTLEEMKNDFVNTVSHDLKNPIAVIEGMATLIHRELPGDRPPARALRDDPRRPPGSWPSWSPTCSISERSRPDSIPPWSRWTSCRRSQETVKQLALQAEAKRIDVKLAASGRGRS